MKKFKERRAKQGKIIKLLREENRKSLTKLNKGAKK